MLERVFLEFLFSKGFFVENAKKPESSVNAFETVISLAELFGIKIESGHDKADLSMVRLASKMLGENVPEPFYMNFPESVKRLSKDELLFDQLLSYYITYGWGMFDEARHSIFESDVQRKVFNEYTKIKRYQIISEEEAISKIQETADDLIKSSRPLSQTQYSLLLNTIEKLQYKVTSCACKDTLVNLIIDTCNIEYASLLKLSDVIRLAEELQRRNLKGDIKHLNLRNQQRKLIASVLDYIFTEGSANISDCFEKKQLWAGLLHHIHYKPVNDNARDFINRMRGKANYSAYSYFEKAISEGNIKGAVDILLEKKGSSLLLRNLTYILCNCKTSEDKEYALDHIQSRNKILLLQLYVYFNTRSLSSHEPRTFMFTRYNKLCVHREDPKKAARRKLLSNTTIQIARDRVYGLLKKATSGTLSRVYIDPEMKKIAIPLQESSSMSGIGTLPKGSRIQIPEGKKIRGFTYWEKVDDVDLSVLCFDTEWQQREFSWRTMYCNQSDGISYSGDITSGYYGGSEYFDIDIDALLDRFPDMRYAVFCNNVYSNEKFSNCYCTAGYMLRDKDDSGEVFEPKTVESSFRITCQSIDAFLFALDLAAREFIWLNIGSSTELTVAGIQQINYLKQYFNLTKVLNIYDLAALLASEIVDDPNDADVIFSNQPLQLKEGVMQIRSIDTEKIIALIN